MYLANLSACVHACLTRKCASMYALRQTELDTAEHFHDILVIFFNFCLFLNETFKIVCVIVVIIKTHNTKYTVQIRLIMIIHY